MKKYLIAAVIVFSMGIYLRAEENLDVPSSEVSNPIGADYGGVEVATSAFSAAVTTVTQNYSVAPSTSFRNPVKDFNTVYGAHFSTGMCGDFMDVFVSTGIYGDPGAPAKAVRRIYNVANSTGTATFPSGICAGEVPLQWPIRVRGNLFFKLSTAEYNRADMMYWKEPPKNR